ncbi:dynactin subunit 3-like [Acanthaster planci]|uniref:Dynactin subunit 3-like n=1 Tax=Acanthaster planci TaxID=133434 RepID=A0A8B7ZR09_ACAPL|nr:dynactin subunit 3-like [Acanthaster planci]
MAATSDDVLEVMEARIKLLEDRVCGTEAYQNGNSNNPELIKSLSGVKQTLDGLTSGKERIQTLWKRLDEMNCHLDPEVTEKLTLTEDAKADIILAEETQLKKLAGLLEKLQGMRDVLDSEHTKGAPAFRDKLQPLVTVQLDQKEHADRQSKEVSELLEAYNNIVTLISQQFVQWDAVMTRYEVAKKVRDPSKYY